MTLADLATDAHAFADWRLVEGVYGQVSGILDDPERQNYLPEGIAGFLAEALGRTLAYYQDREETFVRHLLGVWGKVDRLEGPTETAFATLYHDQRFDRIADYLPFQIALGDGVPVLVPGRRRPKPFEAAVETCRRLRDVNSIRRRLQASDIGTAAILGGSISYGRFFNVRGDLETEHMPSDVDLMLICADYAVEPLLRLLEEMPIFSNQQVGEAVERISRFPEVAATRAPCIFSHKLDCWAANPDELTAEAGIGGTYQLSLHVFSRQDFEYLILSDISALTAEDERSRELWDFRNTEPKRLDNQRCFAGLDQTVERVHDKIDQGYVGNSHVFDIRDGRYYPGLYQNLVLPQFEVRWESLSLPVRLDVLGFRWKVIERLREERRLRPREYQRLSLSHTRSSIFAPHVTRRVDRD
jgi:hypothetical protein